MGADGRWARLTGLLLAACLAAPGAALEVPYLTGRVNDLAGLLGGSEKEALERTLAELEERTGAQVAVLTIPSLEGEVLEDYSLRVAETWQLGQKGQDNGVLFLVAVNDRQMRLEVGYGLEGTLPDATCRQILDGLVRPRFRAGDFAGGLREGVQAVAAVIQGDTSVLAEAEKKAQPKLVERIIFLAFFLFVVGTFSLTSLFAKGCSAWFFYVFLIPFWLTFPGVALGPYAGLALGGLWLLGFPIAKIWLGKTEAGKKFIASRPRLAQFAASAGRMASSRSSGGFSGGGGSFGGGGASSRW